MVHTCSVGAACDISARDGDEIVTVVRTVHDPYVYGLLLSGLRRERAVHALFSGNLLRSFLYHPAVLYIAVFGTWFMVSQTVQRLSRGKIRIAMHFRTGYLWVALGLIVVNFLIKNLALLIFHVDLMA